MSFYYPSEDAFRKLAGEFGFIPVFRRLAADTLTPVMAYERLRDAGDSFLFESVVGGEHVGRYSFLACQPFLRFLAWQNDVKIITPTGQQRLRRNNPLEELRALVHRYRTAPVAGLPPFVGGAVGYLSYDTAAYSESLPRVAIDDRRLPDVSMSLYDQIVIIDNVQKTLLVVALADVASGTPDVDQIREATCRRVDQLVERLTANPSVLPVVEIGPDSPPGPSPHSNMARPDFENAVRKCVEYIRAGDVFQVVISQRWSVPIRSSPLELYRTLRTLNPSPFMFLLKTAETTLVGSSPEIMCRVVGREVTVRPLAGTRARGATEQEDREFADELADDAKERAEHVMLVDLGRNDVGRISRFGTVKLSDVMTVERYSHVMHLTSNISGQLRDDQDAFDALMACLPAGTVSGAPKIRAMEIIDEMEPHRRGPYAGAVGYFDFRGNMDTCITLRTIVLQDGIAYVQAGAGIVADSQPSEEYMETVRKAHVLLEAIRITEAR